MVRRNIASPEPQTSYDDARSGRARTRLKFERLLAFITSIIFFFEIINI